MNRQISQQQDTSSLDLFLGGERANPRRGAKYETLARAFVRKFPPGSEIDDSEFAAFLKEWGAVPQGRGRIDLSVWAERLRSAGSHPRLPRGGSPSFTVRSDHAGGWLVLACATVIRDGLVLNELRNYSRAQGVKLRYVAEGVDVSEHSPINMRLLKLEFQMQVQAFSALLKITEETAKRIETVAQEIAAFTDVTQSSLPPAAEKEE